MADFHLIRIRDGGQIRALVPGQELFGESVEGRRLSREQVQTHLGRAPEQFLHGLDYTIGLDATNRVAMPRGDRRFDLDPAGTPIHSDDPSRRNLRNGSGHTGHSRDSQCPRNDHARAPRVARRVDHRGRRQPIGRVAGSRDTSEHDHAGHEREILQRTKAEGRPARRARAGRHGRLRWLIRARGKIAASPLAPSLHDFLAHAFAAPAMPLPGRHLLQLFQLQKVHLGRIGDQAGGNGLGRHRTQPELRGSHDARQPVPGHINGPAQPPCPRQERLELAPLVAVEPAQHPPLRRLARSTRCLNSVRQRQRRKLHGHVGALTPASSIRPHLVQPAMPVARQEVLHGGILI